jgi:cation:H+ antiporter
MLVSTLLFCIGIVLLYLGAESLVRGGQLLGRRLGVSSLVVGLTVVAISTSMPEAIVSLLAQVKENNGDIALGNVIGSNIANIGLVLGLVALICPQRSDNVYRQEVPVMLVVCLILLIMMLTGKITVIFGFFLVLGLICFLIYEVSTVRHKTKQIKEENVNLKLAVFWVALGMVSLLAGGELFLSGAMAWGGVLGISDRVMAVTVVALGTSLPELATSVVAAARGDSHMALGNVIGSVIFNVLFVVGSVSLVSPIVFSRVLFSHDVVIMLLFVIAATIMSYTSKKITRVEGGLLLIGYITYIVML